MSRTSTASSSRPERPGASAPTVPEAANAVDRALAELGVRASRSMGQSFLVDPFIADALAALAGATDGRRVVEVGGGLGIVTQALLRRGVTGFTVVEKDRRLAGRLARMFGPAIHVDPLDAMQLEVPRGAVIIGSLPYSVATPLLLRWIHQRVERIAVLVQKEVAERFGAPAGSRKYGRPSILAACLGEVELFQEVPPSAFHPRPQVAGRMMTFRARVGALPVGSVTRLESVARTLFSSRRKQLANLLPRLGIPPGELSRITSRARWPAGWERLRPEDLPPEAYFGLVRALEGR